MDLTRRQIQDAIMVVPDMPGYVQGFLMLFVNLISDKEIMAMGQVLGEALGAIKAGDVAALRSVLKACGVPADLIE
jgi:hypothetical protein